MNRFNRAMSAVALLWTAACLDGKTIDEGTMTEQVSQALNPAEYKTPVDMCRTVTTWPGQYCHACPSPPECGLGGVCYPSNTQAIDIAMDVGTNVYADRAGRVCYLEAASGLMIIDHDYNAPAGAQHAYTWYAHLSSFLGAVQGQTVVAQGQLVAKSGNTGIGTGPHLHWAVTEGPNCGNSGATAGVVTSIAGVNPSTGQVCPSPSSPPPTCSNAGPFSGSGSGGYSGTYCLRTYSFNVVQGATYTISTCGGYGGDPYLVVTGACSCRNDDTCYLGSQCQCTATATGTATICASTFSSAFASWNYQVTCGSAPPPPPPPPPPTCTPNRDCAGRCGCGFPDGCGGTFCCSQTGQEAWGCGNLHPGVCWSDGRCYCPCGIYQHAAHEGAACSGSCNNTPCTCP